MQYSLKVYLLFHTTLAAASVIRRPKDSSWDHELLRRVESTTAGLSLSRLGATLLHCQCSTHLTRF